MSLKDVSLFYMASIAKENQKLKLAAKLFEQIFDNRSYDKDIRQVSMNEQANIYQQGYKKMGIPLPKYFKKSSSSVRGCILN